MRIIVISLVISLIALDAYALRGFEEDFVTDTVVHHPNEATAEERKEYLAAQKKASVVQKAKELNIEAPNATQIADVEEVQEIKRSKNIGTCADLGEKILKCEPYKCTMPHPEATTFQIEHEISGFVTDDLYCNHTQTIPGNGIIDCRYSKAMRIVIAKQFASKEDLTPAEMKVLSDSFPTYCRVIQ